jgi:PAS domain S-box-containing protein
MNSGGKTALSEVAALLTAMQQGKPGAPIEMSEKETAENPELQAIIEAANTIVQKYKEAHLYLSALSSGNFDVEAPRDNIFVSPYKQLQSSLKHLVWQTKQVAQGDFTQRMDFMGDFSDAFNSMVASLFEKSSLEEILQKNERLLSQVFESIQDGICVLDKDLTVIKTNSVLEKWRIKKGSLLGLKCKEAFPNSRCNCKSCPTTASLRTGQKEQAILKGPRYTTIEWMEMNSYPFKDNTDTIMGIVMVMRDISERIRWEEQLIAAKEAAEAASLAKTQFLASMSHEIRTPMNSILGTLDLLDSTGLTEQQLKYTVRVKSASQLLLNIINDILDLTKIESGKIELEQADFYPREDIQKVVSVFRAAFEQKDIKLDFHFESDIPNCLRGDSGRLQQVVFNLVGNALKFTEQGSVMLTVEQQKPPVSTEELGGVELLFSVRDTGIGIAAEVEESIFGMFSQADSSTTRKFGGTGLGLAISRQLVELMGGRIWYESTPQKGTSFFFTIRFAEAQGPGHALTEGEMHTELPPLVQRPLKILVAEDNLMNRELMQDLLALEGHEVSFVVTGREAVGKLKLNRYDLVLMDVEMPEMDGVEATQVIRSGRNGGIDSKVPIIAMTAHALKGDRERLLAAGMDGYLSKPISISKLRSAIAKVVSQNYDEELPGVNEEAMVVFDSKAALERMNGNETLYRRILEVFLKQVPEMQEELSDALQAGDSKQANLVAHSFKSSSATVGAEVCRELLQHIEITSKNNDIDEARLGYEKLEVELQIIIRHIDRYLQSL